MSARRRRAIFSNPIRMSAARTHGVAGRLLTQGASEMRYCARRGRMEGVRTSLLPDSIRKLCDKCTLFSNRTLICGRKRLFLYSETM